MALPRPSRSLMLGLLLSLSVITMLLGPVTGRRLRRMVHWAFAPLGDAGMYLATSVKGGVDSEPSLSASQATQLRVQNAQLLRRLSSLEDEVMRARQIFHNGRRVFSGLFGPSEDTPVRLIPARVVAADALVYGQTRLVNAGQDAGLADGQLATTRILLTDRSKRLPEHLAVLSGQAVAGRIVESAAFTARLQLVTDRSFAMPALIRRRIDPAAPRMVQAGSRMVPLTENINVPVDVFAVGSGTDHVICSQVSRQHNILPGDVLMSRPSVGLLPVAVTIGTVSKVQDDIDHPGRVTVTVEPAINPQALRNVYIVVPGMGVMGGTP